ncbi:hypothetical protein MKEN_00147600 [Mycena kentingensis (nom. inval.)]|nr:hypothetical protein MKEN_00147600 [Mycena kentingensis (nom. inval.)]
MCTPSSSSCSIASSATLCASTSPSPSPSPPSSPEVSPRRPSLLRRTTNCILARPKPAPAFEDDEWFHPPLMLPHEGLPILCDWYDLTQEQKEDIRVQYYKGTLVIIVLFDPLTHTPETQRYTGPYKHHARRGPPPPVKRRRRDSLKRLSQLLPI